MSDTRAGLRQASARPRMSCRLPASLRRFLSGQVLWSVFLAPCRAGIKADARAPARKMMDAFTGDQLRAHARAVAAILHARPRAVGPVLSGADVLSAAPPRPAPPPSPRPTAGRPVGTRLRADPGCGWRRAVATGYSNSPCCGWQNRTDGAFYQIEGWGS